MFVRFLTQLLRYGCVLVLAAAVLEGCAIDPAVRNSRDPAAISVTTAPSAANVTVGASQNFTAVVTADSKSRGVTWSLSGAGCSGATCGTLTNVSGIGATYTAPASVPSPAVVTLTAASAADPAKSSSSIVTIVAQTTVSVSPSSASVSPGMTQNFTAAVTGDPANKGVVWTLSGSGCSGATCGTLANVTTTAVAYTAPASVPSPATVMLTASSLADASEISSAKITIVPPAIAVTLSPSTANITTGQNQNFTATVSNDPAYKGVTWSLSGSGCSGASCGTLTNQTTTSVTYTAPVSAPSPATVALTATSAADSSKTSSASITIVAGIAVSLSPTTANVTVGANQKFQATVSNDPTNKGVTWSLSGSGCSGASCGTLTNQTTTSVTYTAPASAPSPAAVTLTATSIADTSQTASAIITVAGIAVSLSPTTANLGLGANQKFQATVSNDPANKGVTWSLSGSGCSGASCGTLTNQTTTSVTYTAPASVPASPTLTLTATSVADNSKTSAATITIVAGIAVSLSPTTANVTVGANQKFQATVSNDPANKGVTWSLSGSGCSGATCGTLTKQTAKGVTYTAPPSVPSPATVTLTATSISDGSAISSATITVVAGIAVNLSPSTANVTVGANQKFQATLSNDRANKGVTWSLSGSGCSGATCGTLTKQTTTSVTYTAPASAPSPATVTLTATSVADTSQTSSATVTIVDGIAVSLSPTTAIVTVGANQKFQATVSNDPANKGVTWSLSGSGCSGASCGTLTNQTTTSVTYTAPVSAPSPATVALTATSAADSSKTSSATITIVAGIAVSLSPTTANVTVGANQKFQATVSNDPANKGVTWSLSGSGCSGASCGTLTNQTTTSVTYTAPASLPAPPTVTLNATSVADNSKTSAATITIVAGIAVSLTPSTANVTVGANQKFQATVSNDPANKGVAWSLSGSGCSGASCGTLTNQTTTSVTYTAPASLPAPPTVTLNATSVADNSKTSAATITIVAGIAVSLTPTTANVTVGANQKFQATVSNDPANKGVTWSLSGSGCSGASCGTLTNQTTTSVTYTAPASAPSPATVTLTATSAADNSKTSAATITIVAGIAVSLTPTTADVTVGANQKFQATVSNDPANKGVTWSLSGSGCSGASCGTLTNQTTTSVTYTAPASAPSPATVTLTATSAADSSKTSSASITIVAGIAVSLSPTTASVSTADTRNFTATVSNDPANKGVTWSLSGSGCSGASCGTLTNQTTTSVTYTAPGSVPAPPTVTLTATSVADNSQIASATITIVTSGSITVSISPKRAAVVTGGVLDLTASTNDSAGVTWSVSPGDGSFSPQSSQSNNPVTFTAPSSAGVYTITATSVSDGSASASITIGVTDLAGVFTYHNDTSRDGVNSQEYALTPANVNTSNFGKLFSCQADGAIYAEPLWVPNVTIGGAKHNLVVVATARDSVYVFDADASPCVTYWHDTLIPSGETYGNWSDLGTHDIYPDIGIIGTPVIDPKTDRIYVVAKTKVASTGVYHQRLYALNLADGSEPVSPVDLTSSLISVPGTTGDTCTTGSVSFCPQQQNQRPGLALVNGTVYVAWAAHEDHRPYHGWVVGFSPSTLGVTSIYNDSPNTSEGGIWMSGGAPASDSASNLYVITANGNFDGKTEFGDSFLKLGTGSGLKLLDSFTPTNQSTLDGTNGDLGAGAAVILTDLPSTAPVQHLLIGGGKDGELYVLNRDNLGGYDQGNGGTDNVVQEFSINHPILCAAVFWQNTLYIGGVDGPIEALKLNASTSALNPVASSQSNKTFIFPAAEMSISSSGTSDGILWAVDSFQYGTSNSGSRTAAPAVLHAYDATNLSNELWNSSMVSSDAAGNAVKFTIPTVANGKVYLGTRGNDTTQGSGTVFGELDVYGLKPN